MRERERRPQPPFGPSVASLCHPSVITTNLSYKFPVFETSATALCGATGMTQIANTYLIYIYNQKYDHPLIYWIILDHLLLIWNKPQSIISLVPPYGNPLSQPQSIITSYDLIVWYSCQPQIKPLGCLIRGGTIQVSDYTPFHRVLASPIYGWF